jgi:hypothetical protein
MAGFDEYGCGDRVYEHLRRNLIGNLARNWQERVVSNDHIFCPRTLCGKERYTLAFAKPLRRLAFVPSRRIVPTPSNPGTLRPPSEMGSTGPDITGMDRSSDDLYENIVSSKLFAL